MSLISDALRKARQEAAARDRGGVIGPGYPPRDGSRLGMGLVLGALIALAATLGGGAVAWWLLGTGTPAATDVVAQDPGMAPTTETGPVGPEVSPSVDAAREGKPGTSSAAVSAEPESVPDPASAVEDVAGTPAEAEPDERATVAAPPLATAPPFRPAEAAGERVFFVVADLGDRTLTLDYLVHRATDPFAQVNGLEVHVGSTVAGCRVEAITEDAVHLRDAGGEIVLRAR